MAKKVVIYIGKTNENLLENIRKGEGETLSKRANRIFERFNYLMKGNCLRLDDGEVEVLKGVIFGMDLEMLSVKHLSDVVLNHNLGCHSAAKSLTEKIDKASDLELIATLESLHY